MRPYETDGLTAIRELPWAVALPGTEDEVCEVLAVCREHAVPVVPRGAGTGLSGRRPAGSQWRIGARAFQAQPDP